MTTATLERLTFDPIEHKYFLDGKWIKNVTSIIQANRLIDLSMIPEATLEYKSSLGTALHYAIHLDQENNLDESSMHQAIVPYFQAYRKFCEVHKFEPRHTELRMFSEKYRYAGTLDAQGLFFYKGKETEAILDWKTTWRLYPCTEVQLAAYKMLFEENHPGLKVKRLFGLQLKPTGTYEIEEYDFETGWRRFQACLVLERAREEYGIK